MEKSTIYTNEAMFNDIKNMLEEVNNPKDEKTAQLLKVAEVEFTKPDQSGSDECVDHFIAKYPLLAQNCPKIFREALLVNRDIDLNMVRKALNLQEKLEAKQITYKKASEKFGMELAERFFPETAHIEAKRTLSDPHKMDNVRRKLNKAVLDAKREAGNNASGASSQGGIKVPLPTHKDE